MTQLSKPLHRTIHVLLLLVAAAFLVLHFAHLSSDFPNSSPWMDWSKYTDEGWYGDAAIRHFQLGHWFVDGDFNPAAALPVWPFLEGLLFRVTGVSLVAARALTVVVFAGTLAVSWLLIRRDSRPTQGSSSHLSEPTSPAPSQPHEGPPLAASVAVLLLAISPFCFVFTRLAILEPLLILLTLLALLAAQHANLSSLAIEETLWMAIRSNLLAILALGFLLPIMVLTKTTALFLMPAVAWMLFASVGYRFRTFMRVGLPAALLGLCVWLTYFVLLVRPHFLLDYRYLFSANAYTGITLDNFSSVLLDTLKDGTWMGFVLYPSVLAAAVLAFTSLRAMRDHPLIPALILWAGGYTAFLAYHANLQPRYYLVVAVPLTLVLPVVLENWILPHFQTKNSFALALGTCALLLAAIVLPDARETLHFVRHPEYTLVTAAHGIDRYIEADRKKDPTHNPLVLSISGSDLSLITGLPSICDDFGTLELSERVKKYKPGWYVAWNQIDDDKMDSMTPLFHVERVAAFPAMDDPERNLMILYRLDRAIATPHPRHHRKPIPRALQTKLGQQPSTSQLEH